MTHEPHIVLVKGSDRGKCNSPHSRSRRWSATFVERLGIRLVIAPIVRLIVLFDCVGSQQKPAGSNKCYICGGFGHIARDCPNQNDENAKSVCYNCGKPGHIAADCPEERFAWVVSCNAKNQTSDWKRIETDHLPQLQQGGPHCSRLPE